MMPRNLLDIGNHVLASHSVGALRKPIEQFNFIRILFLDFFKSLSENEFLHQRKAAFLFDIRKVFFEHSYLSNIVQIPLNVKKHVQFVNLVRCKVLLKHRVLAETCS